MKLHQALGAETRGRGIDRYTVHPGSMQTGLSSEEGY